MLTKNIKYLDKFLAYKLPVTEYIIVNSSWLSMMNLRENGDLDIIISNNLWDTKFNNKNKELSFGLPGSFEKHIRVHSINKGPYVSLSIVKSSDELIRNHKVMIDGIPFISPKIYFLYKIERIKRNSKIIDDLPWWYKTPFYKGLYKKNFLKKNKDINDFKIIKSFFNDNEHLLKKINSYKNIDWGLENKLIKDTIFEN